MKKKTNKLYNIFNFKFKWSYYILFFLIVNVFYLTFFYDLPKSKPYTQHELHIKPKKPLLLDKDFSTKRYLDFIYYFRFDNAPKTLKDFQNNLPKFGDRIDVNKLYGELFLKKITHLLANNDFVKSKNFETFTYDYKVMLVKKFYNQEQDINKNLYYTKNLLITANEAEKKAIEDIYEIYLSLHNKINKMVDSELIEENEFIENFGEKLYSIEYKLIFFNDDKSRDILKDLLRIFVFNILIFFIYYKFGTILKFYIKKIKIN